MATQPMPLAQFGQTIKAKHPEYKDIPDEELASKVLAKYPQYSDMVASKGQPTAEPSLLERGVSAVKDAYNNYNVGLLKGAGQTVGTVASLINKIPLVGETLSPSVGIYELKDASKPQGIAQNAGAMAEQAGEMALTGGPIKSAALKLVPAGARFLAPAARIAAEGTNAGLSAGLHGESIPIGAASGGAGAAVSELLPAAIGPLKKAAVNQYQKFLNPTKESTKYMARDITPELINRGEVAISGQALEKRAGEKAAKLGSQIDSAVANVPASVKPDSKPVLDTLEKYKQSFIVNGVPVNESAVSNAQKLQDMVTELGPDLSYQSMNRVRQILDKSVAEGGGYVGKTLADGATIDAQREAANAIRKELSRQSPDIAKINAEFHFWRQVQDTIGATNKRQVGQQGGLGRLFAPLVGAGGGFAHGGMEGAAAWAGTMYVANEAIKSPLWRTASPVLKDRLANAIAKGDAGAAAIVLGRLGAASQNAVPAGDLTPAK